MLVERVKVVGIVAGALYVTYQCIAAADATASAYILRRAVSREEIAEIQAKVDALYNVVIRQECPGSSHDR